MFVCLCCSDGVKYYTGTLLSLEWVLSLSEELTAALDPSVRGMTVYAGFTRMADIKKAQRQPVREIQVSNYRFTPLCEITHTQG